MKNIIKLLMLGFCLIPFSSYANTIVGSCHDSYFIEKNMNVLDTMNLLISGSDSSNSFTCQSFNLFESKQQEYKVDINTEYNGIPYILEFIGKQAPNNNGLVFIPSDAILINYRTEQIVSHFPASKIVGACNVDKEHIHSKNTMDCLIALNKSNNDTIAIKIHFNSK